MIKNLFDLTGRVALKPGGNGGTGLGMTGQTFAWHIMSNATNWHTADTFLIDGGYAQF